MAAYAIARYTTEDANPVTVAASLETALEALDSTNDPVVLCTVVYNAAAGKYVGILLTS
jgi:hypothetical protein